MYTQSNPFAVLDDDEDINNTSNNIPNNILKTPTANSPLRETKHKWTDFPKKKEPSLYISKPKNKLYLLCNTILDSGVCKYGRTCMFAHTYNEQVLDQERQLLYNYIKNPGPFNIDLSKDKHLIKGLICLSNVCVKCNARKCAGGYNCRYGAIDTKHQICIDDMYNGSCDVIDCPKVHLTKKGIKPINNKTLYAKVVSKQPDKKIADKLIDKSNDIIDISDDELAVINDVIEDDLCNKSIFIE